MHRDGLSVDPLALATTTPALYFTRWITHLCAPGFALLAGASAGFQRHRGASAPALSRLLWTRGLSLVLMELTVIRLLASLNVDPDYLANLQVIWVIGSVDGRAGGTGALAAARDSRRRPAHRLRPQSARPDQRRRVDQPGDAGALDRADKLWMLLHQNGLFPLFDSPTPIVRVNYPVLPWIGVLAVGYVFADLWLLKAERRRRVLAGLGLAMIAAFVALRVPNLYGDPLRWQPQATLFKSVASFMNVQKYPPSLLYLLATLGPALLVLSRLEGRTFTRPLARAFVTYGRVPMFFYLLQWLWAHACGLIVSAIHGAPLAAHFQSRAETFLGAPPPVFGGTLLDVYVCWFLGAIVLYFPCRWYAGVKARRKDLMWLRYL